MRKREGGGSVEEEEKQQQCGVLRPVGQGQREKNDNRQGSPLFHCMTSYAAVGMHSHSADTSSPIH